MELTRKQIEDITLGALYFSDMDGAVKFHRMTKEQVAAFMREREGFGMKTEATAAVRFDFYTDASFVRIKLSGAKQASSRKFFGLDVHLNEKPYMHFYAPDLNERYPDDICIPLDGGQNRVQVFFPNLSAVCVSSVSLSDGATVTPVKPPRTFIAYGDSITQGFDAEFPSRSYVNTVATMLDACVHNIGVGGATHDSDVIVPVDVKPDFITVAYGTNDWFVRKDNAELTDRVTRFYEKLRLVHGDVKTFSVLPIWRVDWSAKRPYGNFYDCRRAIGEIAAAYGCTVIDDINLVPHDTRLYTPHGVHPNDLGFDAYGMKLADYILSNI